MSRINTNVPSLIAQRQLAISQNDLSVRLERLSTGLQINRGADNPAGLIVSERLRSEINSLGQAISNAERASNVIATTEAALDEVSRLLNDMKGLVVEAANTGAFSPDEIRANQLQIDSAVESITRISNTSNFAGLQLLNGSLDYILSGVNQAELPNVNVYGAKFGNNPYMTVDVETIQSAQPAQLFISGNTPGSPGALLSSVTFSVRGPLGVEEFRFVSGVTLTQVADAINGVKDTIGVSASLRTPGDPTSGMVMTSLTYGTDAFISVKKQADGDFFGTFDESNAVVNSDEGQDVLALVNGKLALGDGLNISMNSTSLNVEMTLSTAAAQSFGTYSYAITGGGAQFQVGPNVDSNNQVGFGMPSVAASSLGNFMVGYLSSIKMEGENSLVSDQWGAQRASRIIDAAIDQVSKLRGRLGAFERNTLDTTIRSQTIALENLTASESAIRDTDFAAETSRLSRSQILVSAGTSALAMANSQSQTVLNLLQ